MNFMKKQKGFTLIELIIVIVILGILAAFVVPRFGQLDQRARAAVVNGMGDSVRGASAIAHSLWLTGGRTSPVTMEDGSSVAVNASGFPTQAGILTAVSSQAGIQTANVGTTTYFCPAGTTCNATGDCFVIYDPATGNITVTSTCT